MQCVHALVHGVTPSMHTCTGCDVHASDGIHGVLFTLTNAAMRSSVHSTDYRCADLSDLDLVASSSSVLLTCWCD